MTLEEEIVALRNEVSELRQKNQELVSRDRFAQDEIDRLKRVIESLKYQIFGKKSERVDEDQLLLELEERQRELEQLEAARIAEQAQLQEENLRSKDSRGKRKVCRIEISDKVEVVERVEIPEEVKREPDAYERVGEPEVTEMLDVIPMRVIKLRIIRPRFRRKDDRSEALKVAHAPDRILKGGYPTAGLLAFILVSKYLDHLPLHRLESIFKRAGVIIPRQRMCHWIHEVADNWLGLIYYAIRQGVLEQNYLRIDETPICCVVPDKGSHNAYVWVYVGGDGMCFYDWQNTRGKSGLSDTLNGWNGKLLCDGYGVYKSYAHKHNMELFGCNAHARRKFDEAWKLGEKRGSAWYLLQYRELFKIERNIREEQLSADAITERRESQSRPIFDAIKKRMLVDREHISSQSKLNEAFEYMQNHWDALTRYIHNPEVHIDNNAAEQAVRPLKLGMKNWLFVGHPNAGKNCAILFTILQQCKTVGINPMEYLTDVFNQLPTLSSNPEAMKALTPQNWAENKKQKHSNLRLPVNA